jgi:hypothetical protein
MQPPSRPDIPSSGLTLAHADAVAPSPERLPPSHAAGNDHTDDSNGDSNDDVGDEMAENPYADNYVAAIAQNPTMRDMVATYVYSLTVASVRKIAKQFAVKQSGATRSQLRGMLFAAAAAKVADAPGL